MEKCYCNSSQAKSICCEPFLTKKAIPETAEQLMRSRYSAYVTGNIAYILDTHHVSTSPIKDRKSILNWTKSVKWLGLTVHSTKQGHSNDTIGYVHFTAVFMENGQIDKIEENSHFVKENNKWYYAP